MIIHQHLVLHPEEAGLPAVSKDSGYGTVWAAWAILHFSSSEALPPVAPQDEVNV